MVELESGSKFEDKAVKLKVEVRDTLQIGDVSVAFQRTLRIPEDSKTYPLTPDLGAFPIRRVSEYADKVPARWGEHGGVFLPVLQREAVRLSFCGRREWKPSAVKVKAGDLCAVTGKPWSQDLELHQDPQDYLVVPSRQPWLDGINSGNHTVISQFIASPLLPIASKELEDDGDSAKKHMYSLQLFVFGAKPGIFPQLPPPRCSSRKAGYGCGCGATQRPCLYDASPAAPPRAPSPGAELWDKSEFATVWVHLCNSQLWKAITGLDIDVPESAVSEETYSNLGLPWSQLYEEKEVEPPPPTLPPEFEPITPPYIPPPYIPYVPPYTPYVPPPPPPDVPPPPPPYIPPPVYPNSPWERGLGINPPPRKHFDESMPKY